VPSVNQPSDVAELVHALPGVDGVRLVGSRGRGDPTPLSDWDYEVDTARFDEVADALPAAVAPARPLATLWDPLGERPNFTVLLDGPAKVDLIFDGHPFSPSPPWVPSAESLPAIDAHFWDWTLWLGAKQLRSEADLVRGQLDHLHQHLLAPMGAAGPPADLADAVESYLAQRSEQERRFGVVVDRRLGDQVAPALASA
jgi:predicted nucleotidyltransferase